MSMSICRMDRCTVLLILILIDIPLNPRRSQIWLRFPYVRGVSNESPGVQRDTVVGSNCCWVCSCKWHQHLMNFV